MAKQSSNKTSAMAQLMAKHQDIVTLKKGESVKAKITKLTSSEVLVNTGAKSEAIVLEKDRRIMNSILSTFKLGDTVEVSVINTEAENGMPLVSLRKFLGNISWKKMEEFEKSKEQIEVTVTDVTKAGYVVVTDFGVSGFLPQSHVSDTDLQAGQSLKASVLELNRKDNKVIFSQKPTMSDDEFAAVTKQLKPEQKLTVTINNIAPVGLFVNLTVGDKTVEGFIHVSEVAWEKVDDLAARYQPGQSLEAVVTKFENETRRINLSIKRLTKDPFEKLVEAFPVDKKVSGVVTKVDDNGVTLEISAGEDTVEGLIKKEKVPPGTTYTVGQTINVTVSEHDKRRHRIVLTPVLLEKPIGYR